MNRQSMRHLAAASAAAALLSLSGCEQEGPAEEAGERIDEAMEEGAERVEEATDEIGGKVEEAGDKLRERTSN